MPGRVDRYPGIGEETSTRIESITKKRKLNVMCLIRDLSEHCPNLKKLSVRGCEMITDQVHTTGCPRNLDPFYTVSYCSTVG